MAKKYDLITKLYDDTCLRLSEDPSLWQAFLKTAGKNFKLRFDEQVLIFAQRPDATAVLEIERWNKSFGRWVNRGAKGIAVFEDANRNHQRLIHYFDISDTHESRIARSVPMWQMRPEYESEVVETLKNTFGEVSEEEDLLDVILSCTNNAIEDNISDYLSDFMILAGESDLNDLSKEKITLMYREIVSKSVSYMLMSRLGLDADSIYSMEDFKDLSAFHSVDMMGSVGIAVSDISQMEISVIAKTITSLNQQNRIIDGSVSLAYNKDIIKERSSNDGRNHLQDDRRLPSSEPDSSDTKGSDSWQMGEDETRLSEDEPQDSVLQLSDEGKIDRLSGRGRDAGEPDAGAVNERVGEENGSDRGDERSGYDEMGGSDEQFETLSRGDRERENHLRLETYDRRQADKSLPFFGDEESIKEILAVTPYLSKTKEEIKSFFENNTDTGLRTDYVKSVFNHDPTQLTLKEGRTAGYKTYENVLHLWEGDEQKKTAQGFYDWQVIVQYFDSMRLLGELNDINKPLPSLQEQQVLLSQMQAEKPSAFTFSQEIIDAVLVRGSGISEGKYRIFTQFIKSLSEKENVEFLKNEYGTGGSYPVLIGTGIDESHDAKGIVLSKGTLKDASHITLSWMQAQKRIAELIALDRYLNPKETKNYPAWLAKREEQRAEIKAQERNREILSALPEETIENEKSIDQSTDDTRYDFHLGDVVYIGASEYEILSMDEDRVMLFDTKMPLINKELSRTEFEEKVRENPMNDHLKVKTQGLKEKALEDENEGNGEKETEPIKASQSEVTNQEGQESTEEENASKRSESEKSKGIRSDQETVKEEISTDTDSQKAPERLVPAWEKKKRTGTKGFDLHPDIPMSKRHTFDLSKNPVEIVGKKERFRRNVLAVEILQRCQEEDRFATEEEQLSLSKYVGWGGLSEAFDERNSSWENEYTTLLSLLSKEAYQSARESTLTAFYTPPAVITAIYKVLDQMGFKEGNVLEPSCGIGNFIGMLPDSMKDSKIYGVEIDEISAGIARQLYQRSSIAAMGFESVDLSDSFFDIVIGNVPFGDFKVFDQRYDRHHFLIHDYFFAKSLDKLRPGGVMALVTSKGTMDKENPAVRKYLSQRAELLGAIRLPNDTFKGNAGTEVVSDILFLQKRDRIIDLEADWVHLDTDENGIKMNAYFVNHPEMILGQMKIVSGRFGMETTCEPFENADLEGLLSEAITNIHGEIEDYEIEDESIEEDLSIPADPTVRNFSFALVNDRIYFRENARMSPVEVSETAKNRIKGMIKIKDAVRELIALQTEDFPEDEIQTAQQKLGTYYDSFTKQYGLINSRANTNAFCDDSSYALICALEVIGEEGELLKKADIFYKRTIRPHKPVTKVDTFQEALAVSIGEKAGVDMAYMSTLTGKSEEALYEGLKGLIFKNPLYEDGGFDEPKYLTADAYLSGNVREKLALAKKMSEISYEDFAVNAEALEKVLPKDLTAGEIAVRLGATWIPKEIITQFVFELLDTPNYARWHIKVNFSKYTGEWQIEGKSSDPANVKAYTTYGTKRINAYKIIEETLNLKDVRIFDYIEDEEGKKKALINKKETAIAQAKQELIKQGFSDWIWKDPPRREKLTKLYNERFNSIRPREYDGSHIVFNGMNPEIELMEHQKNAVAHILYGGNTLLAHTVGAGKTFEMAAAAMESKRLGLCHKSLFVVPNHLTQQWAAEFLQLYPAANILVATKRDFEMKNRKKFCGRIATGDYDAVIIGHSQFEKIPMSIERQRMILEHQLEEITEGISDLKYQRGENFSVKQLEKSRRAVKQKLDKLNDQSRKDDVVTFEELGVDRLFIDESHQFKNLYLYTKMRNVGGIAQTEAQKSSDLFMKCRYLDEVTGSRGIVFATGTPISNSMVELYTIQRYLQYETLVKNDLVHFDSWASTFGETVTAVELTPEGTGYRAKTRFAKFYNLPELMAMFKEAADIKTADMLDLPVPKANFHNVSVKPSVMQKEMVAALSKRAEAVRSGSVDPREDNMLKITNDGRKLALDARLLNDMLPDFEGSKVNACVKNIFRIWKETTDQRSAQLVFCDLSTPKNDDGFCVYDDIKKKLLDLGIPESEIKFIHEADTEIKKKEVFRKTRKGEIRVLLGSTQKMGAGTNVQDRLIALHDIDCPWRPSDLEQRAGRIIRQGNLNPEVEIYRYVTEQTFDAYLYQLVEGKQKFAGQIMTSKSPVRCAEDIDETALSYAEIKMLATGNPHIKEKMDLDIQVQKLRLLKANFLSEKYALEDKIIKYYPQHISALKTRIDALTKDVETVKQHPKPTDEHFIGMDVSGVFYTKKAEAGQAIIDRCKQMQSPDPIPLGQYRGFETELLFNTTDRNYEVRIIGETVRNVPLGEDAGGNIIRIDNALEKLTDSLSFAKNELENAISQFETAKKEVEKPFLKEEELKKKTARLDELNILLNMDKPENEFTPDEPDEREMPHKRKEKTYER